MIFDRWIIEIFDKVCWDLQRRGLSLSVLRFTLYSAFFVLITISDIVSIGIPGGLPFYLLVWVMELFNYRETKNYMYDEKVSKNKNAIITMLRELSFRQFLFAAIHVMVPFFIFIDILDFLYKDTSGHILSMIGWVLYFGWVYSTLCFYIDPNGFGEKKEQQEMKVAYQNV